MFLCDLTMLLQGQSPFQHNIEFHDDLGTVFMKEHQSLQVASHILHDDLLFKACGPESTGSDGVEHAGIGGSWGGPGPCGFGAREPNDFRPVRGSKNSSGGHNSTAQRARDSTQVVHRGFGGIQARPGGRFCHVLNLTSFDSSKGHNGCRVCDQGQIGLGKRWLANCNRCSGDLIRPQWPSRKMWGFGAIWA